MLVVGGGAAGCFGALEAAGLKPDWRIAVLEASQRPLSKVLISGGGRCNVTHSCFDNRRLVGHYPRGSRELLGPFSRFGPAQTIEWFQARGVELVVEADGRMFPSTNKSQTIANTLLEGLAQLQVPLLKGQKVVELVTVADGFRLTMKDGSRLITERLLMATGSSVEAWQLLKGLGHSIVEPVPSLFTFKVAGDLLEGLAGQTAPQVHLNLSIPSVKRSFRAEGPLLVTHWGVSGPGVLRLSAFAARELAASGYQAQLTVDWTGGGGVGGALKQLEGRKQQKPHQKVGAEGLSGLSRRMWQRLAGDLAHKQWQELGRRQLAALSEALGRSCLAVDGKGVFKEEFVTCGGVERRQVDFRRMESKLHKNLFFAGEVLDIDGVTGGFNFQNAWTGSWIAAQSMADSHVDSEK